MVHILQSMFLWNLGHWNMSNVDQYWQVKSYHNQTYLDCMTWFTIYFWKLVMNVHHAWLKSEFVGNFLDSNPISKWFDIRVIRTHELPVCINYHSYYDLLMRDERGFLAIMPECHYHCKIKLPNRSSVIGLKFFLHSTPP